MLPWLQRGEGTGGKVEGREGKGKSGLMRGRRGEGK